MVKTFLIQLLIHESLYNLLNFPPSASQLRLLTYVGFFSKTGSDTFRSVLIYEKEQESRKNFITVQKSHLPEKV